MANIDTRWEQALLNKVTSNGERIAVMERDIKDIKDNSVRMQEDISELKNDVSTLKSDVSTLKSDVSTLKSDVSTLKSDVSTLKSDVSSLDSRLSNIEKLIDGATKLMKWILGGIGAIILSLMANFIYAYIN